MIADELGASPKGKRRAALLHDIGKAVSHEIEGPHARGRPARPPLRRPEAVAHAMEAHHERSRCRRSRRSSCRWPTPLRRPSGRRGELEQYVKRLRDLEEIATRHQGVEKVYAMQAGREIRGRQARGGR